MSGIPLSDPKITIAEAEKKDYEKRREDFLKEVKRLEFKFNIAFGAELRSTPMSLYCQLVVIDLKKIEGLKRPTVKN